MGETVTVAVPAPEPAEPGGESIPLNIVFEDDAIIVIDKPAGLVVHPAAGHATGTLVNALIAHCGDSLSGIGGVKRPGIVHRLDKDTTGLMVVAKTDRAHQALAAQFADHGRTGPLRRGYLAFVWGAPARPKGTIDEPIDRHPKSRDRMAVRANGRIAITHWQVLERFNGQGRQTGGEPDRVPAGDRPHPPDPRPSGACRPSAPGRRHLWHRLQDQGDPAAARRRRRRSRPLDDRPCMLICWPSNTRRPGKGWSSDRNYPARSGPFTPQSVGRLTAPHCP